MSAQYNVGQQLSRQFFRRTVDGPEVRRYAHPCPAPRGHTAMNADRFHRIVLTGLALAGLTATAGAADPEWKVGLAQVKVTPERPVLLSGYGGRNKPFEKVAADLYVKALVLEDRHGHRGVIVTSDLLGFP